MEERLLVVCFLVCFHSRIAFGLSTHHVLLENNNDDTANTHNNKVNGAAHASKEVEQSIKIDSFANSTQNVLPRTRQGREHDDYGDYTIIVVNARNNMNQRQQYYDDDCCGEGGFSQYMSRERAPELFLIGISVFLAYLVLTSQNSSGRKRRSSQDSLSSYDSSTGKAHLLRDALAIQQALQHLEAREIPAVEALCHINRIASKGERTAAILLMASAALGCALNPQPFVAMVRLINSAKAGFSGMVCSVLIVSE